MMTPDEILMSLSQAGGSCCSERCYPQKKAREALVLMKESALEQAAMMAERSQGHHKQSSSWGDLLEF
jgi:hypothetical protein